MEWIQGDKFKTIADFTFSPKVKHGDDYDNLPNTFDITKLRETNIIYTHLVYTKTFIDIIKHINKKFILITHSCDCRIEKIGIVRPNGCGKVQSIDEVELPDNLIKWYSKNVNTDDPRVESIPIGLENNRWFVHLHKIEQMQNKLKEEKKIKNILYINHNIATNPAERLKPYSIFNNSWTTLIKGHNGYKYERYLDDLYNHKFILCPQGNGMDTHRTWEALYLGTIPIEKRNINNQFYIDLPICFVDDWEEITEPFLKREYERITTANWNLEKLDFNYWKNKIQNT